MPLSDLEPNARGRRSTTAVVLAVAIAAFASGEGRDADAEDAPEVLRLSVPRATFEAWYPEGEGVIRLEAEAFEKLARAARSGARGPLEPIRVAHRAHREGDLLVGTTVLRFPPDPIGEGPRWVVLDGWSPAVESVEPRSAALLHRDDGRPLIRLEPGDPGAPSPPVTISWRLRGREGTSGGVFDLRLPELPSTSLTLELPEGLVPSGPPGHRQGPDRAEGSDGALWRFDGPGGPIVLRIRDLDGLEHAPGPWIGGIASIRVGGNRAADGTPDSAARWSAEWSVEPGPQGYRPLEIRLSPGLEWEDVVGLDGSVAGIEGRHDPAGTLLTVRWREGLVGPTRLALSGMAPVPDHRRWSLPFAEPIGASWIGGGVDVRIGPEWALVDLQPDAARRIDPGRDTGRVPPPSGLDAGTRVVLHADRPGPLARLELRPSRWITSATVRGLVRLLKGTDALEAEVWLDPATRKAGVVELELSPGWWPESVRLLDDAAPLRWEQDRGEGGTTRVRVQLPSPSMAAPPGRSTRLQVLAGSVLEDPGRLALPRLRPVGLDVGDERWTIRARPGVTLRPASATGLAWVDPSAATSGALEAAPAPSGASELAWRWVEPGGSGRVDLLRVAARPSATVGQRVTIGNGRMAVRWDVRIEGGGMAVRSLPYQLRGVPSPADPASWDLLTPDGPVPLRTTTADPAAGPEIRLPRASSTSVAMTGRLDLPWSGAGELPRLVLPRHFETRGSIALRIEPTLGIEIRPDPSYRPLGTFEDDGIVNGPTTPADDARTAATLRFDGAPGPIEVRTIRLPADPTGGAILHAELASRSVTGGVARHRLVLDVAPDGAETLDVALPTEAILRAATRAGRPIRVGAVGKTLRLPLPPASGRPSWNLQRFAIDFETPATPEGVERPPRPTFSLPCLAFAWRPSMTDDHPLSAIGLALIDARPGPDRRALLPGPWTEATAGPSKAERAMLEALQRRLDAQTPSVEADDLGGLLARWDAGRWPLIVDVEALETAGIGPDTRMPDRFASGPSARGALAALNLRIVPIDTVLLVTTPSMAPNFAAPLIGTGDSRDAWADRLREAVIDGLDRSGRFQTVERWRASPLGSDGATAGPEPTVGGSHALLTMGWPRRGVAIWTANRWPWTVAGIGIGALIVASSRPLRRRGHRGNLRGIVPGVAAVAIGVALSTRAAPTVAGAGAGLFLGGLIAVAIGAARLATRRTATPPPGSTVLAPRSDFLRGAAGSAGSALLLCAVAADGQMGPDRPDAPIVAMRPYDGPAVDAEPDPDDPVWLRSADFERLAAIAEDGPDPASMPPRLAARAADHVVRPSGHGTWIVESRLELWSESGSSAEWTLPIRRPVDLKAELDGRPCAILIGPGGDRARVAVAEGPPGPRSLTIRQEIHADRESGGDRIAVPVNPLASSSLEIAAPPEGLTAPSVDASGASEALPDGGLRARIGPVERLEIRWGSAVEPANSGTSRVESALLWRALPAADHLEARITVRGGGPVRTFPFAVGPGAEIRSIEAEGARVALTPEPEGGPGDWIARFEPPLPDVGVIRLELWSPREPSAAPERRRPPLLTPRGPSMQSGRIALLRPEGWGGRLEASPDLAPLSEQEFEQEWGVLPREAGLDPAGASRFVGDARHAATLGPSPDRREVVPTLDLELGAGRWEWAASALIADRDGRPVHEARALVPNDLELVDVEGPGLTSWDRPEPTLLRLRFDGDASPSRSVSLVGWLPQRVDPMSAGPSESTMSVPWPSWPGAEVRPGTLTVGSASAVVALERPDLPPAFVEPLSTQSGRRRTFDEVPIDRGDTLRSTCFPTIAVDIASQLTIGPGSTAWEALVRYRITGGPADRIELDMPPEWSRIAEFELIGSGPSATLIRGERVEIIPRRPIWGGADLRIRASRALEAGAPVRFPELTPWGRGRVRGHVLSLLAPIEDAPTIEATGLDPADSATLDGLAAPFNTPAPPGTRRTAFRVRRLGWSLTVRTPPLGPSATAPGGDSDVGLVEARCGVGPDGTVRGRAVFHLEPPSGPFLELRAPHGATAPAAAVDGRPVSVLIASPERWVVPLGGGPARRVELVWIDPPSGLGAFGRRFAVPVPVLNGAVVLASIHAMPGDAIDASGIAVPAPAAAHLADRLERLVGRIIARLKRPNQDETPGVESTVDSEVARAMALARSTERSAHWGALVRPDAAEVVRQRGPLRRVADARETLAEALRSAGFDELALAATDPDLADDLAARDPGPEPDALPLTLPGPARHFLARAEGDQSASFTWSPAPPD